MQADFRAQIILSPFGAGAAQRGGHRAGHDIVVPPVLFSSVPLGLLNHAGRRKLPFPNLAFFQGKLNLHIPYEYSFGIRQGLYKAYRSTGLKPNRPSVVVREGHEAKQEAYFEHMSGSKLCVAAAGFGFSTRAYEAAAAGCVPLVMQDGIEQAYEEILPWGLFSLRINNSLGAIAKLNETLAAIPEGKIRSKNKKSDTLPLPPICHTSDSLSISADPFSFQGDALLPLLRVAPLHVAPTRRWRSDASAGCRGAAAVRCLRVNHVDTAQKAPRWPRLACRLEPRVQGCTRLL